MTNRERIDWLEQNRMLPRSEMRVLLDDHTPEDAAYLFERARAVRDEVYGRRVFLRGLIEISSYCKNDCYYCGLRRGNQSAERYRLGRDDILACCAVGYALGLRTFVLQGGEDPWFTDARLCDIVRAIHAQYPDCAITLSLGERSRASYAALRAAGADRYLLRHETANEVHYNQLHPEDMKLQNRMRCLSELKELGYQAGCGFMVGSPGQTTDCLLDDLAFLHAFRPAMVGVGPFLPHRDTPFAQQQPGSAEQTLFLLGVIRLLLPGVLLPATTALGTASETGRERGLEAGANVIMPNISPPQVREQYKLYDGKRSTGAETAEGVQALIRRLEALGYDVPQARGDAAG